MIKNRRTIAAATAALLSLPLMGLAANPIPAASLASAAVLGSVAAHEAGATQTAQTVVADPSAGEPHSVYGMTTISGTAASKSSNGVATGGLAARQGTNGAGAVQGETGGTTTPGTDEADDTDNQAPVVDTTAPVISGSAYGPMKGVQTFPLTQVEDNPARAYVEIQQKDAGGTWRKHSGEWFYTTNTFAFSVNTEALADGADTQLKVSTWDTSGNHASATFPVIIDRVKPVTTLVTPNLNAPQADSTLSIQLDGVDDHGLQRLTANIYQGDKLVRSTSSSAGGALQATHTATVNLPDGEYTIRYNASDLAGNIASTGRRTVQIDTAAPVITAKDGASMVNGIYNEIPSFKLMDQGAGQVDYVIANGVTYDRTNNKWSDLNAGDYKAVQGENVITLFDTAGNSTSFTFTLDTVAPRVVDIAQKYEEKEGGRTAVTLTFSEPVDGATLGQGWYGSGTTFTKVYYREKAQTVSFLDNAGNNGSYTFTAQAPVAEHEPGVRPEAASADKKATADEQKAEAEPAAEKKDTGEEEKSQVPADDDAKASEKATSSATVKSPNRDEEGATDATDES